VGWSGGQLVPNGVGVLGGGGRVLAIRPDLVMPLCRRAMPSSRCAMGSSRREMTAGRCAMAGGLDSVQAWKPAPQKDLRDAADGVWRRMDARIFMEFPFPLLAPDCGSLLEGSLSLWGRGRKIIVCILFGYVFGGTAGWSGALFHGAGYGDLARALAHTVADGGLLRSLQFFCQCPHPRHIALRLGVGLLASMPLAALQGAAGKIV
jgi:hypothetical protein